MTEFVNLWVTLGETAPYCSTCHRTGVHQSFIRGVVAKAGIRRNPDCDKPWQEMRVDKGVVMAAALPACYSRGGWCQSSTIPYPTPVRHVSFIQTARRLASQN